MSPVHAAARKALHLCVTQEENNQQLKLRLLASTLKKPSLISSNLYNHCNYCYDHHHHHHRRHHHRHRHRHHHHHHHHHQHHHYHYCYYYVPYCSAFALEAAKLLKARGAVSPVPAAAAEAAEDPEDGELPAPPPVAPEQASKKRKHPPIVWQEGGKRPGLSHSACMCLMLYCTLCYTQFRKPQHT